MKAQAPLTLSHAPSIALPLSCALLGLSALATAIGWLIAQPTLLATYHYNQQVIALTHLFVLGWVLTVVMGAMYQLVPVALATTLYSERLARWQVAIHAAGFIGMVWMFRAWNMKQVGHFGCILAIGIGLFVYNVGRTLAKTEKWTVPAHAMALALAWLTLGVTAGLSIAVAKCSYDAAPSVRTAGLLVAALRSVAAWVGRFDPISAMHAHAHLGILGCFTILLVGVSYKLIPMFTLSKVQSERRAFVSLLLLNAGLAGSFVTILLRSSWKLAFTLISVAGIAVYLWELSAILRARKRRTLDWGLRYFLTAVWLLVVASLLALTLSWPGLTLTPLTGQLENTYGFIGLIGVLTFAIIGMMYKILPFLIWFGSYSSQIGFARVPALADLPCPYLQATGYWSYLAGLAIIIGSETAVRWGCSLLGLSIATLLFNTVKMLAHLVRPKFEPLVLPPKAMAQTI